MTELREKAIAFVKQAVEADNAQKYEEAFGLYMHALDFFEAHLKYEKNPRAKEAITKKFKEYLARAEQVRALMDAQNNGENVPTNTTATAQADPNQKGGAMKNEDDSEKARLRGNLGSAIISEKPNVKWDDVAGLDAAKDALKEAVILPVKYPQFFTGKRKAWSGLLLYGPPGTGKSYLAKAVATEADSTFFAVSSSNLVSKWMGESEKLVSQLFQMARESAPSIIFIDELDSLCSSRGEGESEAARRIKTEFLVQMQGVGNESNGQVLVLGATNMPYSLDQAVRRRFDKRIYIPLPEDNARAHMFKVHLGDTPSSLTEEDYRYLGAKTAGFSGSDVATMVKDVLFEPVRKTQEATHFKVVKGVDGKDTIEPCSPGDPEAFAATLEDLDAKGLATKVMPPKICRADFERVLIRARPTVGAGDLQKYEEFTAEFGEEG
eukprot:CAMPEP_0118922068 /NCGR_PEP_ID=MMETSP1169-20130426/1128_1 /TAXON_ID=36882 /ORGANISM="Pyramimonas obovata, Strain CCMP722" /LENGTH=436 /DNA_ID=CAMNT_0006862887 /DNA_START=116 /DNA_END=1426 /DNA_ORIENTATION=+